MSGLFLIQACMEPELYESEGTLLIEAECVHPLPVQSISSNTKTAIEDTDRTVFLWETQETVGVYGNSTVNAKFVSSNDDRAATAKFTGAIVRDDTPKYIYYPYTEDNNSCAYQAIRHELPLTQVYNTQTKNLPYDFKVGEVSADSQGLYSFYFDNVMTYLRVRIDASGTALEGDELQSIIMTAPSERILGGEFSVDLSTKAITWENTAANEMVLQYTDAPALSGEITAYMSCAPGAFVKGDKVIFTFTTNQYLATVEKTIGLEGAVEGNKIYTLTFKLSECEMSVEEKQLDESLDFKTLTFETSKNSGKIFDKELYYNNQLQGTTVSKNVSSKSFTIDAENNTASICIPYLYDFTLIPTFTLTDSDAEVYVGNTRITSGETAVTFTNGGKVRFRIKSATGINYYDVSVSNTGLPVVVLTTGGAGTEEWSQAGLRIKPKNVDFGADDKIAVYYADGTVNLAESACGFRLRGNSSKFFPKKQFAVKLDSKANLLDIMSSGSHKRWCLLANYIDRTLARNAVAFEIANSWIRANAAKDGILWSPSGKNVELVIDGRHVGNYFLCEQIKVDKNRLAINDCFEDVYDDYKDGKLSAAPTVDDCGYLLEFDDNYDEDFKFVTGRGLPCMFKDPFFEKDTENIPPEGEQIFNTVKGRINAIEQYLEDGDYENAYSLLDINSVIDWWVVQELTMNNEYKHPKSVYMYINGSGKLFGGPVWDFDWQTFANPDVLRSDFNGYTLGWDVNQWLYKNSSLLASPSEDTEQLKKDQPYMWYPLLFRDPDFRKAVQTRWGQMYATLSGITAYIETMGQINSVSESYNFSMWPVMSDERDSVGWIYDYCGDEYMSWEEAIANMKSVYQSRLATMNSLITSGSFVTNAQ